MQDETQALIASSPDEQGDSARVGKGDDIDQAVKKALAYWQKIMTPLRDEILAFIEQGENLDRLAALLAQYMHDPQLP